ncbi:MarR family transcriptional regulator [Sulfitobacter sp. TSTF-M16]|uniref:MarR family transcriptional regulator n=2 Tax=Sulfitobacter aestuariivivens TaxID=2766981 RepID=A0A927HEJ0_9RHOB|nr:MarR family transcriptional regulator [Sulfitobacter aestuariivivens]
MLLFEVFNEIGIIEQLSRDLLEAQLPEGLIAPHFSVLNHLIRRGDGALPINMARAFQVPKTSMTHTLKGLEKGGYVVLKPNPEDGRSKQVWLTDKGRMLRDSTIAALAPELSRLTREFESEKLMDIKPVLTELRIFLDAARDPK